MKVNHFNRLNPIIILSLISKKDIIFYRFLINLNSFGPRFNELHFEYSSCRFFNLCLIMFELENFKCIDLENVSIKSFQAKRILCIWFICYYSSVRDRIKSK